MIKNYFFILCLLFFSSSLMGQLNERVLRTPSGRLEMTQVRDAGNKFEVKSITINSFLQGETISSKSGHSIDSSCDLYGYFVSQKNWWDLNKDERERIRAWNEQRLKEYNRKTLRVARRIFSSRSNPTFLVHKGDFPEEWDEESITLRVDDDEYHIQTVRAKGNITRAGKRGTSYETVQDRYLNFHWYAPNDKDTNICSMGIETIGAAARMDTKDTVFSLDRGLYTVKREGRAKNCIAERKKVFQEKPVLYLATLKLRKLALEHYLEEGDSVELKARLEKDLKTTDRDLKKLIEETPDDKKGACWEHIVRLSKKDL